MKKIVNVIFAALFILFLLIPVGSMLLVGESEAGSNEILAAKPAVFENGKVNIDYLNELTDYFADRFAFRQEMITLWAQINSSLFHTSTEKQVIIGSENMLYYAETMDDYCGYSLDGRYLDILVNNVSLIQEFVETNGGKFVFTVAPNKNSIYPENMPSGIVNHHSNSNISKLSGELSEFVNYADLFDLFSGADGCYYYSTDTHWTDVGAALGANLILEKVGIEAAYSVDDFSADGLHTGDLYEMLYPVLSDNEEKMAYNEGFCFSLLNDDKGGNALKIKTENNSQTGRLFCWRDSFGISLYPYLAEKFGESQFLRSSEYNLFSCESFDDTAVIIEIVERNLDYLITYAPRLAAPERTVEADDASPNVIYCSVEGNEQFGGRSYTLVKAAFSIDDNAEDLRAYYVCGDKTFEAYITADPDSGMCCANAWIAADMNPDTIILSDGGVLVSHNIEING